MKYTRHKSIASLLIIVSTMICGSLTMSAQDDIQFTQYWAVPTYYNPAASGQIDYLRIRGGGKLQWVGIDNAPTGFMGAADMPIKLGKKQRIGVGVDFMQEGIGLFSNMLIGAQVSYKFKMLKGTWSVGVQPGYFTSKFKGSKVYLPEGDDYHQTTDQAIPTTDVTGNSFDLSAGLMYSHKYFNIGISCLHIMQPTVEFGNGTESSTASETEAYSTTLARQFYFTADSNIELKNTLFSLQPSLMVRTDLTNFSAEATMRATYNRFLSFGVGYRYKSAISAMVAAEFKNFFIGYAYDYATSAIAKASSGSHELVIGYKLKLNFEDKNRNKHRSIRIM